MVFIAVSAAMTLVCQGCVTTAPYTSAETQIVSDAPKPDTTVSTVLPTNAPRAVQLEYEAEVSRKTIAPRLAFEAPRTFAGPIQIENGKSFSATRLYANERLTSLAGDTKAQSLSPVPQDRRSMSAQIAFSARSEQTGLGFDLGLAPRLSIEQTGALQTRRFGGEVRIGQNFDQRGEGENMKSWYLFAAADGEALVWDPSKGTEISPDSMALRDKVTVGDMQAGISFQQGPGQVSVSYIRREVEYRERNLGASEDEDFAGITFTIKR